VWLAIARAGDGAGPEELGRTVTALEVLAGDLTARVGVAGVAGLDGVTRLHAQMSSVLDDVAPDALAAAIAAVGTLRARLETVARDLEALAAVKRDVDV
jgi:hypothetical protein